jgi:hypothetical protein
MVGPMMGSSIRKEKCTNTKKKFVKSINNELFKNFPLDVQMCRAFGTNHTPHCTNNDKTIT